MNVVVNGSARDLPEGTTVAEVVRDVTASSGAAGGRGDPAGAGGRGVAVAINGEVVRRGEWADRRVRDGDRVEVLTAVQGG